MFPKCFSSRILLVPRHGPVQYLNLIEVQNYYNTQRKAAGDSIERVRNIE